MLWHDLEHHFKSMFCSCELRSNLLPLASLAFLGLPTLTAADNHNPYLEPGILLIGTDSKARQIPRLLGSS